MIDDWFMVQDNEEKYYGSKFDFWNWQLMEEKWEFLVIFQFLLGRGYG